jgi:UDP-N-acetylglucosamine 2-epimerase (non-hydrolysing)
MIVVVYGTTGELIKIMPILKSLDKDSYITVCTYQQPQQLARLFADAKIERPDITIGQSEDAEDLERLGSIPLWFTRLWWGFFKNRRNIKRRLKAGPGKSNVMLIHGDTTTTLMGAVMGKILGLPVAHVEAGLRSYNWRHPFPEELNRIYTSKIARLHFSPGKIPVGNLHKAHTKGEIINTKYNTVLDSLRLARDSKAVLGFKLPKKYGLVSIHRNELLAQPRELESILKQIAKFADKLPIIVLDHPITKERMQSLGYDKLLNHKNITRVPKQSYYRFIQLLTKADCVITDSGGLQEESAYLGIPCLVHRKATEREEGLGQNVVLSRYDKLLVKEFCDNYSSYRREGVSDTVSPTRAIIKTLRSKNYI